MKNSKQTKSELIKSTNELKVYDFLKTKGLQSSWEKLRTISKPTVFLKPVRLEKNESKFKIGETKLWGRPHLPAHIPWPKGLITQIDFDEKNEWKPFVKRIPYPLLFLGQVNFKDISQYISDIPKDCSEGIIYFFISPSYDELTKDNGSQVSKDAYKVLFYNGPLSKLTPIKTPRISNKIKDHDEDFKDFNSIAFKVDTVFEKTFPSNNYKPIKGIFAQYRDNIQELCFDLHSNQAQLFGYSVALQDPPEQDTNKYILIFCCHGPHDFICYFFCKETDFKNGIFSNIELVVQRT